MIRLLAVPVMVLILALAASSLRAENAVDCDNAMSTMEMNACADKDFEAADAELNATYQKALKGIPGMASDPPYDAQSWEEALLASQRAWLAFRDAECVRHVSMFWSGGSGTTVEVLGCKTGKTKERIKELKDRYETE